MEHTQQMKLKERQKFFEEAFQQDMEQYLSTGYLQIAERRGEQGWLGPSQGSSMLHVHRRVQVCPSGPVWPALIRPLIAVLNSR